LELKNNIRLDGSLVEWYFDFSRAELSKWVGKDVPSEEFYRLKGKVCEACSKYWDAPIGEESHEACLEYICSWRDTLLEVFGFDIATEKPWLFKAAEGVENGKQ